jgi:hypothetical protein
MKRKILVIPGTENKGKRKKLLRKVPQIILLTEETWIWIRIRIWSRNLKKRWIRIRIKSNADPTPWEELY